MSIENSPDFAAGVASLTTHGFVILRQVVPPAVIAALDADLHPDFERTPFCTGGFYGETTKRFGRILSRSDHAIALALDPLVLAIAGHILEPHCDTVQLNVGQAIAIHPGAPRQLPHRDHDMWRAPFGAAEYLINAIWPLTRFTAANGATLVWPGTHRTEQVALDQLGTPVFAEMEPGDVLLFLGSTVHGAGANSTNSVRRGLVLGYSLGWLRPYENPSLAYPPDVARTFPPALAALLGYRQHRPNLGNFEGQCPSVLLTGTNREDAIGAIDALRPDQSLLVDEFVGAQKRNPS
jgi:Phytanoyl-CoA dioxygenase (PhyH)